MRPRADGLGETLERLLPFFAFVAVVTAGWFWFLQPHFSAYLRTGADAAALEERVRMLQQAAGRTSPEPAADLERTQGAFEKLVSADDEVSEVAAAVAETVLANAPAGKLRSFVIDAGDHVSPPSRTDAGAAASAVGGAGNDAGDPRLALFPYAVSHTPLRVSFESTFEAAGSLLWHLRDLPTVVEVRSATLTRGHPLMKTEVVVRVLQRAETVEVVPAALPAAAVPPGPTAPRLAPSPSEAGVAR